MNPPTPSTSSAEMSEALQRGEQFRRIFVDPMIEAVRSEMQGHVAEVKKALDTVSGFEGRVAKLEKDQKKALLGWSVYATAAAGLFTYAYGWIKSKVHIS